MKAIDKSTTCHLIIIFINNSSVENHLKSFAAIDYKDCILHFLLEFLVLLLS